METALKQIGENVRRRREELGIDQEELAHRAGLNRTMISLVENGKKLIRIDTMIKLSRGLGIQLEDLLDGVVT